MNQGASKHEVAAELGISFQTLNEWSKEGGEYYNPVFSEAIKKGELLSRCWWEKQGRINLENNKFNTPLWSKNMNCRFRGDWSEKLDLNHGGQSDNPFVIEIAKYAHPDTK